MEIDIEEIQQALTENEYMAICQGDDSIAQESLDNARIFVRSITESYGLDYDEADTVLRLAVKKRALAELYIYAAEWTTAELYQRETERLLSPLAPVVSSDGKTEGKPSACTVKGSTDWKGYN